MSKSFTASLPYNPSFGTIQLGAALIAFWPVWRWYCERMFDRSDEPLGILALITVLALVYCRNAGTGSKSVAIHVHPERTRVAAKLLSLLLVVLYCCLQPWAPPLVLALIAVSVVALCLYLTAAFKRPTAGDWVLLMLSLPLVASLNFYCGYPLRILASHLAAFMLSLGGLSVSVQGAELLSNNSVVGIDQPCSGIRMLWVALYLAAALASMRGLKTVPTLKILVLSVVTAIAANAVRVSSLFYLEAGIIDLGSPWHSLVHTGLGVVVFAICAVMLMRVALAAPAGSQQTFALGTESTAPLAVNRRHRSIWTIAIVSSFILSCAIAAVLPTFSSAHSAVPSAQVFHEWPASFDGQQLKRVQLSPLTMRFADGFPGKIAVFTTGKQRVVYRWVTQATRRLHPSENCFSGGGYQIKALPEYIDQQNNKWGSFEAANGSEKLLVRERLYDEAGHSWTDVSAWYWSVVLKKTSSPWWSVTVSQRIDEPVE